MAWKMDANYGKMVNNLLNKEKPPMDENGNYIINAGTRSEKRIPKAEFEAQQKNAPTQTDMGSLAKLLAEREANRLKAAQEGSQNPEPYNPRAEWVKNNTQTNINYKNNPYFQQNAMGSQMNFGSAMDDRGLINPPNSVKGEAGQPYVTSKANTPMPDIDTPKAIGPKSNTNQTPTTGGNYKDGQVVTQNGIRYIAHDGKLLTQAEVVKDKNLFNKYSNLVSNKEIGDANGPPPAVATDKYSQGQVVTDNGKRYVYNAKAGDFVSEDEIKANPQKYPNFAKTLGIGTQTNTTAGQTPTTTSGTTSQGGKIFTGNTIDPSKDPNNLPYNNPESNRPILPTSYTGQISLPTPPEEMQLMDFLKKQFEDKTWENKYGELQKQYQELANRPDKYSGMIEKAGGEDVAGYIRSLYEGSADPLRREAQRIQEQNAADLAARGLGMSTIVSDVNNPVQRELLANLTDLSNRANVQGRDMYLNALKSAADVYGQSNAQQGNILNAMQTNIGNQMGAQQIGLANINDILAKQEARRLTNMQTGINQWDKDVANYWKYQYYPIDAYAGQNSTANTAAQVGSNQYNQATQNAATQNQTAGYVGSMLAQNMFKQPQNLSWQPVGGLAGAQQGVQAGFNTKPKVGAFNQ